MADVVRKKVTDTGGSAQASITVALPPHESGDRIAVISTVRSAGATVVLDSASTTAGWAKKTGIAATGTKSAGLFWIDATSSSMTAPTIQGATAAWMGVALVIKRHGGTGIHQASFTEVTSSSDSHQTAQVTTTANNCLIVEVAITQDDITNFIFEPPAIQVVNADDATNSSIDVATSQQKALGLTTQHNLYCERAAASVVLLTFAIEDSGSTNEPCIDTTTTPFEILTLGSYINTSHYNLGTVVNIAATASGGSNVIPTLDGTTTLYQSVTTRPTLGDGDVFTPNSFGFLLNNASFYNAPVIAQVNLDAVRTLTSTDLITVACWQDSNPNKNTATYDVGGRYFGLIDTSNNYKLWKIEAQDTVVNSLLGAFRSVIEVGSTADYSSGTLSLSAIAGIIIGGWATDSTAFNFSVPALLNPVTIIGGSASNKATLGPISSAYNSAANLLAFTQKGLASGQTAQQGPIKIGDGSQPVNFNISGRAIAFPQAKSTTNKLVHAAITTGYRMWDCYTTSSCVYDISNALLDFGDFHEFYHNPSSAAPSSINAYGAVIKNATPILAPNISLLGATYTGCKELDHQGTSLTDCTIDNVASGETAAVTITSEAQFGTVITGATFTNNTNAPAIRITGNQTSTGSGWADPGLTVSGNTYDIEYTGTTDFSIQSATSLTVNNTSTGVLTIVTPVVQLEVTSNIASSDIKIFPTGSQTEVTYISNDGSSATYQTAGTYDWTVQKAGYLPQRGTGVVLGSSSVGVDVTLVKDPVYNASHGLTYTTDFSYNRTTKKLTCVTRQAGRDFYSAMIDAFINQSSLNNTPFPLTAVGIDSIFFNDDAELLDATSEDNWYDAGIRYINSSGTTTAEWCSIKSSGSIPAGVTGRYQTSAGGGTTALRTTGAVNQIIQIYGDATHGNFDYRSYLVIKFQANPYVDTRSDILSLAGVSTLEPFEYSVAISPTALDITAGTGGATLTLVDHTAAPITVGGKSFSYEIQDGGTASAEDILRTWDYSIAQTGTYQGTDTFNLPEFIAQSGSTYETRRGIVETKGDTLYGCYVSRGGSDHPGFSRFQSDDGTYYTPAVTANGTITGLVDAGVQADDRLQIENTTALSASAWQAATAYSEGDIVIRSTGLGTENTAGLFFRCTTAGTSHATTEPTWVITTPGKFGTSGSTTTDNTVTWTCFAVLLYDADPAATSWSDSYIDGEEFLSGETYTIRFAEMDEGTTFKTYEATGLTTSSGFTVAATMSADSVFAANGLDGQTYDATFSPDYTNDYIVLDSNTDFTGPQAYAYYCYILTTSQGMYNFWNGIDAIDVGNYKIITSTLDLYFDESGGFVKQTDSSRIYRDDNARPAIDPTTGGSGIEINWRNPVYVQNVGGSALTTAESTMLLTTLPGQVTTVDTVVDAVKAKTDSLTFTVAGQVDANIQYVNDVQVTGTGAAGDEWGP